MIMKGRTPRNLSTPSRMALILGALALLAVFPSTADSRSADGSDLVTEVIPVFFGKALDFDPKGAPLGKVIRQVASHGHLNIVIDPAVDLSSPVTTRFKGIWATMTRSLVTPPRYLTPAASPSR